MKTYKLKREFIFVHQDCTYTILPEDFIVEEQHYDCKCGLCLNEREKYLREAYQLWQGRLKNKEVDIKDYHKIKAEIKNEIKDIQKRIAHIPFGGSVGGIRGTRYKQPNYFFVAFRSDDHKITDDKNCKLVSGQFDMRVVENNPDLFELCQLSCISTKI